MTLTRTELSQGLVNELESFEQLIRSLSQAELDTASRCGDWTAGDVARHVVGTLADVTAGRLDGLGSPEVTAREVAERAGRGADQLADECAAVARASAQLLQAFDDASWNAPSPGGYDGTLGQGVEALWYDAWLHADDIRSAVGRPSQPSDGDGLRCALAHVATELGKQNWSGTVPAVTDPDAFAFVLAATGRLDGASLGTKTPVNIYA